MQSKDVIGKITLSFGKKIENGFGKGFKTYLKVSDDELWLLTMYDKSDIENVSDAFLDDLVKIINS